VSFTGSYLDLTVHLPDDGRHISGLLGNANGDPADDLTGRDGKPVAQDAPFAAALAAALTWRIRADESLFDYLPGETTASFDHPGFPRDPAPVIDPASPEYQHAHDVCVSTGVRGAEVLEACTL